MSAHRATIAFAAFLICVSASGCGGRESLPPPRQPLVRTPAGEAPRVPAAAVIPALAVPEVFRATLATGLRVEVVERRELPLVAIVVAARGFSPIDPLVSPGIPDFTAHVIARELERMAIAAPARELPRPGVAITDDGLSITTQVPSTELGHALAQLSASMRATQCHDGDVVLARLAMGEDERRIHTVGGFTSLALEAVLYGRGDRRAQPSFGSAATLDQLHAGHCAAQRAHGLSPAQSTIAIVGDVDHDEALRLVDATMNAWTRPATAAPAPIPPPTFPIAPQSVLLIPTGSAQGAVYVVARSPGPREPGFAAAGVLTRLLGGMFGARLNLDLRERRGWAYGVHASRSVSADHASIVIACTVQGTRMLESLAAIDAEIARLSDARAIDGEELATAIAMERGSLLDSLETRRGVARALGTAFLRGVTIERTAALDAELAAVRPEDVARVAIAFRRDLAPVVLIGDPAIARELEQTRPGRVAIVYPQ